jgi:hypothetical protein
MRSRYQAKSEKASMTTLDNTKRKLSTCEASRRQRMELSTKSSSSLCGIRQQEQVG